MTRVTCAECRGLRTLHAGRLGPNDPDTVEVDCPGCDGAGDVPAPDQPVSRIRVGMLSRVAPGQYFGSTIRRTT